MFDDRYRPTSRPSLHTSWWTGTQNWRQRKWKWKEDALRWNLLLGPIEITDKNKYTAGVVRLTAAAWRPAQCLVDVSNRPGVASEQLQSWSRLAYAPANHAWRGLWELGLFRWIVALSRRVSENAKDVVLGSWFFHDASVVTVQRFVHLMQYITSSVHRASSTAIADIAENWAKRLLYRHKNFAIVPYLKPILNFKKCFGVPIPIPEAKPCYQFEFANFSGCRNVSQNFGVLPYQKKRSSISR